MYQRFLDGVDVFNFDLALIPAVQCHFEVDVHDRLLVSTTGPIIVIILLGGTYAVAVSRNRRSEMALQIVRHKHVSMVLLVTFLVYSSASSVVLEMFSCEVFDDGNTYLMADYGIDCSSNKHHALAIYAVFMIFVYPLGIPALYAFFLFRNRDMLKDKASRASSFFLQRTSSLWKPYKPERFYYEVIECGRRITLSSASFYIFPNTAAQIAVSLLIVLFFIAVSEGLDPYASRWDCWVNRMGHAIIFTSIYLALLEKGDFSMGSLDIFGAILVTANICMILAVVIETAVTAYSRKSNVREDPMPRFFSMKGASLVEDDSLANDVAIEAPFESDTAALEVAAKASPTASGLNCTKSAVEC